MAWVFSKRCKESLKNKKIKVSLPTSVRQRILNAFNKYDMVYHTTDHTGWNSETSSCNELLGEVKNEHGITELKAYKTGEQGVLENADLAKFVLNGNYPPLLFDAMELFFEDIDEKRFDYQQCVNSIMEENKLPWRMAEGKIFPVDSFYIEEEIIAKTNQLLEQEKFEGALREFEQARTDLANEDFKGAIQNSNLAIESTLKGILGIKKAKPGELFRKIIEIGLIPDYHAGFLKAFEENILRCVAVIRNEEPGSGHGQGKEVNQVPRGLAELAVNLSGVMIKYLINQYLQKDKSDIAKEKQVIGKDEEIPF